LVALADAVAAASGLVMTKAARIPAALVRGLDGSTGDAPPGPASALVRRPEDDLFRESALVAVSAAQPSDLFGPGDISREIVENAVSAACAVFPAGDWSIVAVDSGTARHRLLVATEADHPIRSAPTLLVVCARISPRRSEEAILLSAGAAIRGLGVALHAQGVAWSWDPDRRFDADATRASLALGEGWRPLGIVAAGRIAEGGASRPRPPDPTDALDRRD